MFASLVLEAIVSSDELPASASEQPPVVRGERAGTSGQPAASREEARSSRQRQVASRQLIAFAREWTPRVEVVRPGVVVLDARGLTRLFGSTAAWAERLAEATRGRGWRVRIAVAGTRIAALLLAMGRAGVTVVPNGEEAAALAPLPLSLLATLDTWTVTEVESRSAPAGAGEPAQGPARGRGRRNAARPARHYRLAPAPGPARAGSPEAGPATQGSQAGATSGKTPATLIRADSRGMQAAARTAQREAAARLDTLTRWGLRTLGDLAALPADDIGARLSAPGLRWHHRAGGRDPRPLVDVPAARLFEATLDLEWPIDGLEPLSFVLGRLLEPLCADLHHEERGAALVHTRLDLVSRTSYARTLELPAPMADPRVLRTLILLDLEAHPPSAAIDRVHVRLDPMPARRVQFSLLRRPLPAPDQLATLVARLDALMGAGRCGSVALPDTHRPGAFSLVPFAPEDDEARPPRRQRQETRAAEPRPLEPVRHHGQPEAVLRRFRRPLQARVILHDDRPARLLVSGAKTVGGQIIECAGPWRTSGAWWRVERLAPGGPAWDRDEWDVAIRRGPVYRISRRVADDQWMVEGVWD